MYKQSTQLLLSSIKTFFIQSFMHKILLTILLVRSISEDMVDVLVLCGFSVYYRFVQNVLNRKVSDPQNKHHMIK